MVTQLHSWHLVRAHHFVTVGFCQMSALSQAYMVRDEESLRMTGKLLNINITTQALSATSF